ncbi:MAG: glycosyltransferase [Clostridiales bacterium]|nr:glycosyltransferase [Clostridiales bacterium]
MDLVSVVVVTYNQSKIVVETLDSILKQTYPRIELVVSDDHSTDDTVEVVRDWIEQHKERFENCVLLASEVNHGITANLNIGVRASKGKYVKTLGDDIMVPEAIEEYVEHFTRTDGEKVVWVARSKPFPDEDGIDVTPVQQFCDREIAFCKLSQKEQYRDIAEGNRIPAPSANFYVRKVWDEMGGFDEHITSFEDYSMWLTLVSHGYCFRLIDKELVYYRISKNSISNTTKHFNRMQNSVADLFFRRGGWMLLRTGQFNAFAHQFVRACRAKWRYRRENRD